MHWLTVGMTTWRRQRPDWMTSGMLVPTGTLSMWKVPFAAVMVPTSGEPPGAAPGVGQLTPGVNAGTGALGTKTRTFGSGSVPLGA